MFLHVMISLQWLRNLFLDNCRICSGDPDVNLLSRRRAFGSVSVFKTRVVAHS